MVSADLDRFEKLMRHVAAAMGVRHNPERASAYFDALKEYTFEALYLASQKAIKTSRYFPKPVEIQQILDTPDLGVAKPEVLWDCICCGTKFPAASTRFRCLCDKTLCHRCWKCQPHCECLDGLLALREIPVYQQLVAFLGRQPSQASQRRQHLLAHDQGW